MTDNPDFLPAVYSVYGFIAFGLVILALFVVWTIKKIRGRPLPMIEERQHTETYMAPVLVGSMLQGEMLNGLAGKTPADNYFTYIVSGLSLFSESSTLGMYAVELPYKSGAHLVGLPKTTDRTIDTISGTMEPVVLEGDYPNYFDLYADSHMQTQARYVLDPAAMVFTVDFCQKYEWEILDDTLYFICEGVMPGFDVVDMFIEEIRPAVEIPSDRRKNPYKMSYIGTSVRAMDCPVCKERLVAKREWMQCPKGDGYLITGSQLAEVRSEDKGSAATANDISRLRPNVPRDLTCPYCLNPMRATRFSFTPVMIDICSKCMYRWVDSDEVSVVFGEDPTL